MFYTEVHTALAGVEIRRFYLQGKKVLQVYRNFLCNKSYAQQFYIDISRAV
jgi:hypothetical protein